jgi:transcriptional regulator with XRE-family HTH domain
MDTVDIRKAFGKKLRELRKLRGMTISQLAEACNLSDNFIGSIERGYRSPTLKRLGVIMKALGVKAEELFHFPNYGDLEQDTALDELRYLVQDMDPKNIRLIVDIARQIHSSVIEEPSKRKRPKTRK